jgi:5-methylthioadenosine/S-adenosylhomocysteine deaminase
MGKILFDNIKFMIARPHPSGIVENGWLLVNGPLIEATGSSEKRPILENGESIEIVDCTDKIVMPGFVDSHNHLANYPFNLLPGVDPSTLDYVGVSECLQKLIWPAYTWASSESTYDLTLLSMMNAIKHGTTTITSAFQFPESGYQAGVESKIRLILHPQTVSNVQLYDGLDEDGYLGETEEAIKNFHNAEDGRIQVAVHPHALYSVSERLLVKSMEMAEEYDVGFATHLLESEEDRKRSDVKYADRGGLMKYLGDRGILSPRSLFFHCSLMKWKEMEIFAEAGCAISHNPQSNAIYFGDVADLPGMLEAGVTVGMGTDMPASNMFTVMYTSWIVHSVVPPALQHVLMPWTPLELATIGGARAQRLDDKIGTLEPGKHADIITIDLSRNTNLYPMNTGNLLYWIASQGAGTIVTDTIVDGTFLRRDGKFTIFDEEAVIARSDEWLSKFLSWYRECKASNKPVTIMKYDDYADI